MGSVTGLFYEALLHSLGHGNTGAMTPPPKHHLARDVSKAGF